MKRILICIGLIISTFVLQAQRGTTYIQTDSTKIGYGGTGELFIYNATKNTLGFLKNAGGGKTIFSIPTIADVTGLQTALDGKLSVAGNIPFTQITGTSAIVLTSGSYSNPSWLTSLAFSKLTGLPTTLAGHNISDGVSTSGSYTNPSWLVSIPYSKITGTPAAFDPTSINTSLASKLNITDTVGIVSRLTTLINTKAASTHTHTESQVTNLVSDLASKLNISDTASMLAASWIAINNRSLVGHTHDDRYYTESEITTFLADKANATHTHAQSDITGLATALSAKQATLVSGTNIKTINGASILGSGNISVSGGGDTSAYNAAIALKLNLSDTSTMLAAYKNGLLNLTSNISSGLAGKLNLSDTASMLSNYQTALNNKSNVGHTHIISNVSGLQAALDAKLNASDTVVPFANIYAQLALKAPSASPVLTGSPTATGFLTSTNNSTRLATTAWTNAAILVSKNTLQSQLGDKVGRINDYSLSQQLRDTVTVERMIINSNFGSISKVFPTGTSNGEFSLVVGRPTQLEQTFFRGQLFASVGETANMLSLTPEISQGFDEGYRALFIAVKETSTGTGVKKLIEAGTSAQINGGGTYNSKFNVDNAGNTYMAGDANITGTITNTGLTTLFGTKLNKSDTAAMLAAYQTAINGKAALSHTHAATDIVSGTLADARLSSNVPLKNVANIYAQRQSLPNAWVFADSAYIDFRNSTTGLRGQIYSTNSGGLFAATPSAIYPITFKIGGITQGSFNSSGLSITNNLSLFSNTSKINQYNVTGSNSEYVTTGFTDGTYTITSNATGTGVIHPIQITSGTGSITVQQDTVGILGYIKTSYPRGFLTTDDGGNVSAVEQLDEGDIFNLNNDMQNFQDRLDGLDTTKLTFADTTFFLHHVKEDVTLLDYNKADKSIEINVDGVSHLLSEGVLNFTSHNNFDSTSLSNRINSKLNISDTAAMFAAHPTSGFDSTSLSNRINLKLNLSDTTAMLAAYQTLINSKASTTYVDTQDALKLNISDTAAMLSSYATLIAARATTSYVNSQDALKLNLSDTSAMLANYQTAINGKSAIGHIHAESDVTGLVSDLAGKASTSHTHSESDVTNLINDLGLKATLASPTFTGTVVLPSTTSIGTISSTELSYVDGVTSAIQTQLNGKASSSHTHAESDITNLVSDLALKATLASPTFTGTVVLPSTTSIGTLTSTELGYVHGVTSSIQTQFSGKANTTHTHAESDITNLVSDLAGKASSTHTHAESDITNLVSDLALKAPIASPSFTGTAYAANLGVGVTSGTLSKFYVLNTTSTANNIGMWVTGTSTASSGTTTSFAFTPTFNETGATGNNVFFLSPRYQASGSGVHYLINAGTNTADNASGTHTIKFSVDNAGNLLTTGNVSFNGGTDLVTALGLKANLASPTFTGTVTLPSGTVGVTQAALDSSAAMSTTAYVDRSVGSKYDSVRKYFSSSLQNYQVVANAYNNNTNSMGLTGVGLLTAGGTVTARTVATTNIFTQFSRVGVVATSGANAIAGYKSNASTTYFGDAPGKGGFDFSCMAGISATGAVRGFVGFLSSTGAMAIEPSGLTNYYAFAYSSNGTNWKFFCNDGSGTADSIDLGSAFPTNTVGTDMFKFQISAPGNQQKVYYQITNLTTGAVANGNVTTNIPTSTTLVGYQVSVNSGATTAAPAIDIVNLYYGNRYGFTGNAGNINNN